MRLRQQLMMRQLSLCYLHKYHRRLSVNRLTTHNKYTQIINATKPFKNYKL